MRTVTLTIVPPAKMAPPKSATVVICSGCPRAIRRQMASMAKSAVIAMTTRTTCTKRGVDVLGVPFRGVASGVISRVFARADVTPRGTGESSVAPSAGKLGYDLRGSPLLRLGTTMVRRRVRALAWTATPREEIQDKELQRQLTVDASLGILHPPAAGKPIRHP
jgi:hypothetical protein